ncbi:O-antigen ligase family protein [Legionella sp. WA2024007413]
MKYRVPLAFLSQENNVHKSVGVLFFLLITAAFLFKGTSDYSILIISYGVIVTSTLSYCWSLKSIQYTQLTFLLGIWLVWTTLPPLVGLVPRTALFGIFQCSMWIFGFILFNRDSLADWLWKNLLKLLWILGLICAGYALIQLFAKNAMPVGIFASKNTAAAFLMMIDLLLIGKFFTLEINRFKSSDTIKKIIILNSIYIITLALLAALSRGVILCFICFATLEIVLCRHELKLRSMYQLSGILVLALATLCLFAQPAIQHRLDLLVHEKSRLIIWNGAWQLWQNTPWYGLGIFNFKQYYPAFSLPGDGSNLEYAHNDFLQLLVETGIPGIVILLGIIMTGLIYLKHYLNHPSKNSVTHIKGIACFSALGALVCHSFIDFNFYVFPMNLLMGCCLGYLHYFLRKEGGVKVYSFSLKNIWILRSGVIVFLLVISSYFFRFLILEHYIKNTEAAIQAKQFNEAIASSNHALNLFPFVEIQSLKIDASLQLIQQATSVQERHSWIKKTEFAIKQAIAMNPYFARPYFQMGLLQSLERDDVQKAKAYFSKAIKNDPHFCLARLTFARLLIEKHELDLAQEVLETGLQYPISPEYIELYLNYLAKLRFANGNQEGAQKAAQRLEHLKLYNQDYSDLI